MGTTEQSVLGDLQNLNSLISRDGGKIPQEIVQTISRFKVVEESLHRHAGSGEYRRSSGGRTVLSNEKSPGIIIAGETRAGGDRRDEKPRIRDSRRVSRLGGEESRIRDSYNAEDRVVGDLIAALRSLGYSAEEAQRRVDRASARLTGGGAGAEVAEEEILAEALRA